MKILWVHLGCLSTITCQPLNVFYLDKLRSNWGKNLEKLIFLGHEVSAHRCQLCFFDTIKEQLFVVSWLGKYQLNWIKLLQSFVALLLFCNFTVNLTTDACFNSLKLTSHVNLQVQKTKESAQTMPEKMKIFSWTRRAHEKIDCIKFRHRKSQVRKQKSMWITSQKLLRELQFVGQNLVLIVCSILFSVIAVEK